ncbi:MAG: hypothetical protein V4710_13090, partial [Verrucomicrobiota bacterium]
TSWATACATRLIHDSAVSQAALDVSKTPSWEQEAQNASTGRLRHCSRHPIFPLCQSNSLAANDV